MSELDPREMDDVRGALASLVERVARLEDQVALYQLMMSYGPAVDSGSSAVAGALWTSDGTYDYDNASADLVGAAAITAMVEGPQHQGYIQSGCAHIVSMPFLQIDGDTAVATCYSALNHFDAADGAEFRIGRITANRWEFGRTADGWRVQSRTNRILNGEEEPRALLRRGVNPHP